MPDAMHLEAAREIAGTRRGLDPATQAAFDAFSGQVFADGALSARMKQIVAVAVAHVTRCPCCVEGHTTAALEAGATPNELMEAIWVAAEMHADGSYVHSTLMLATVGEHEAASAARRADRVGREEPLRNEVQQHARG